MTKRKKEDFSNFMASVLQNSMLTGIPQIAAAGNTPKKLVRALVFVMCVVGFVYQSLEFMYMYWQYKTVVDVQVTSPRVIELPSMTVCNYNGFLNKNVCSDPKISDRCINLTENAEPTEYWCKCFPRYCDDGATPPLVPRQSLLRELAFLTHEEYEPYLQKYEEFFHYCGFIMADSVSLRFNCNHSNIVSIRCPTDRSHNMNACYTLHSIMGLPNASPQKVLSTGFNIILVDPMVREYGPQTTRESIEVSFHNPRGIINPYDGGFSMHTSTKNIFHLKKTVKHLLPPPYETNCRDYMADWKSRGGWGPTNERECIEECKANESIKAWGCITSLFIPPSNYIRCRGPPALNADLDVTSLVLKCADVNCKPACYEETYQVSKDVMDFEDAPDCQASWKGNRPDQRVYIQMNFDGMETTTYVYSPKYQNIETFSYLGGYVGMWLGISLVAVFDFLETVILMMRYPCRRYLAFQNRRRKITHIRTMQRDL